MRPLLISIVFPKYRIICISSHLRRVAGESIDNINFLLIWISMINSAVFLNIQFPLTATRRADFSSYLGSLNSFCIFNLQSLISSHFRPKRGQVFSSSPDEVSNRQLVQKFPHLNLKKIYSELPFSIEHCTQSAVTITGRDLQIELACRFRFTMFRRHHNSPVFTFVLSVKPLQKNTLYFFTLSFSSK